MPQYNKKIKDPGSIKRTSQVSVFVAFQASTIYVNGDSTPSPVNQKNLEVGNMILNYVQYVFVV